MNIFHFDPAPNHGLKCNRINDPFHYFFISPTSPQCSAAVHVLPVVSFLSDLYLSLTGFVYFLKVSRQSPSWTPKIGFFPALGKLRVCSLVPVVFFSLEEFCFSIFYDQYVRARQPNVRWCIRESWRWEMSYDDSVNVNYSRWFFYSGPTGVVTFLGTPP